MAKGRKSQKIKVMTYRDEHLLKQLSNSGMCTLEQAKKYCSLNGERIKKLEKSGYIKTQKTCVKGNLSEVIRLNNKGKSYCENKLGQEYFYKTSLRQVQHDLKLTESYYQVMGNNKGATWKNETQLRHEYNLGKDCVDSMVILQSGESYVIEVVGDKYTQKTIENKCVIGNNISENTILIH